MGKQVPSGWHFARPELAEHHLRALDLGLISATALYARRRFGKTEFLMKDLTPAANAKGYVVGYCNLWQEDQEPIEALVEAIVAMSTPKKISAKLRSKLAAPVAKLKLNGKAVGLGEGGAEVEFKSKDKVPLRLRQAFKAFDASGNHGLLLIDEAQVLADKKHEALEKALRALLDTRKDRMKVIFTGSSEDRLRTMFGSEKKAFYNWARVEPLPLLNEAFVRELTSRANKLTTMKLQLSDTVTAFNALNRVPELFRRFLSQYLSHPFDGVEKAIEVSKQSVYVEEGFAKRWVKMLPADRLILQLVAQSNEDLHGIATLKQIGKALGLGKPADRAVPQNSLRRLRERQILIQTEPGAYRFEDETFREWVLTETLIEEI
ncbi:MAG: hypothetical protein V4568_19585 [Pseudomonadota bacterium]